MMKRMLVLLALAGLSQQTFADHTDIHRGQLLYENHCKVCHTPDIHKRGQSKVETREDIMKFVIKFQNHLKLGWEMKDAEQVADYLNSKYYHKE